MWRDVYIAPLNHQPQRCRVVHDEHFRCRNLGTSFPNLNIGGDPLVVCGDCAEIIKPSARPRARMKLTPVGWIDFNTVERNEPWENDPAIKRARELKRRMSGD